MTDKLVDDNNYGNYVYQFWKYKIIQKLNLDYRVLVFIIMTFLANGGIPVGMKCLYQISFITEIEKIIGS